MLKSKALNFSPKNFLEISLGLIISNFKFLLFLLPNR
jgi:hypothetical protein